MRRKLTASISLTTVRQIGSMSSKECARRSSCYFQSSALGYFEFRRNGVLIELLPQLPNDPSPISSRNILRPEESELCENAKRWHVAPNALGPHCGECSLEAEPNWLAMSTVHAVPWPVTCSMPVVES